MENRTRDSRQEMAAIEALEDIKESLEELRYYRDRFFKLPDKLGENELERE